MIPVCGSAGTRGLEQALFASLAMPAHTLMEVAGRGAAAEIHARWPGKPVAVLCGPGNNGGDGFVIARWLALWGHPVRWWAPLPSATEESRLNRRMLELHLGPPSPSAADAVRPASIAVDAMLGTGQKAAPRGFAVEGLAALTAAPLRVAIDLPTGLCAETGQVLGPPLLPFALTLTLGRHKPGLWCAPGHHLAGERLLIDIGLDLVPAPPPPDAWLLEAGDVAAWLPTEDPSSVKWQRGHVAIRAAGGAAVLAAHGAFRSGAGLVTLLLPRAEWPGLHGLWPEVILAEPERLDPARHDALVFGPGLGLQVGDELRGLWESFEGSMVLDADGLTLLARLGLLHPADRVRALTPHAAEAGRMLGLSTAEVDRDRLSALARLRAFGTPLLKGPCTLVGAPDGAWINPTGSVALATAGTGDVLAGLVGGYLARGLPAERALALAAWRHGRAGEQVGVGATASDVVEALRAPLVEDPSEPAHHHRWG